MLTINCIFAWTCFGTMSVVMLEKWYSYPAASQGASDSYSHSNQASYIGRRPVKPAETSTGLPNRNLWKPALPGGE